MATNCGIRRRRPLTKIDSNRPRYQFLNGCDRALRVRAFRGRARMTLFTAKDHDTTPEQGRQRRSRWPFAS